MTSTPLPTPYAPIGRIPVVEVGPIVEGGRWPTKAVVGEVVPVRATVFREGHDAVAASAVLVAPDGARTRVRMHDVAPGRDIFFAQVVPDAEGLWGSPSRAGPTLMGRGSTMRRSRSTRASMSS